MRRDQRPRRPPTRSSTSPTGSASEPFFYDLRSGRAGHRINDVIDPADLEFDPEGLNDYLDFGYCVFERTPVRDVRLLRHSSRVLSGPAGLRVEHLDDPTNEWFDAVEHGR